MCRDGHRLSEISKSSLKEFRDLEELVVATPSPIATAVDSTNEKNPQLTMQAVRVLRTGLVICNTEDWTARLLSARQFVARIGRYSPKLTLLARLAVSSSFLPGKQNANSGSSFTSADPCFWC